MASKANCCNSKQKREFTSKTLSMRQLNRIESVHVVKIMRCRLHESYFRERKTQLNKKQLKANDGLFWHLTTYVSVIVHVYGHLE